MPSVSATIKRKRFEKIYRSYVNDVYRVCLYYSKDERRAKDLTTQVFVEFYKEFEEMDSNHIFAHLVHKAKGLSTDQHIHNFATGEVTE